MRLRWMDECHCTMNVKKIKKKQQNAKKKIIKSVDKIQSENKNIKKVKKS